MRSRAEVKIAWMPRATLWMAAMLFGAGCSTPTSNNEPKQAQKQLQPARVDIQRDETGFTIMEDVRVSAEIRADYENGVGLLLQERYDQGIVALLHVTENAPNVTAAHIDLGIAYGRSGDLDRAEESLTTALELNPRHPIAYNELGMIQRKKGRFVEARSSYEKALETYPSFHFARRNLAILCDLYLADLACALEHYEAYRQAVPDDEQATRWIADLTNRMSE